MSLTKQTNFYLKEEGAFTSSSINLIVCLGSNGDLGGQSRSSKHKLVSLIRNA